MYRYIADLHIGCTNSFDNRTLEHDEILVKNWNSVVNNNDTTFILGDIGRCGNNKDNEYLCSVIFIRHNRTTGVNTFIQFKTKHTV